MELIDLPFVCKSFTYKLRRKSNVWFVWYIRISDDPYYTLKDDVLKIDWLGID